MSSLKIFSWNVNGIRAVIRKGEFKNFINKQNPDILCIQETKAQPGQAEIDLPEYEEYWNSAEKKGYSGTAIFTKIKPLKVINELPKEIEEKYDLHEDSYGAPNNEGRVLAAEFDKFYLVTVYTPNSKDDLTRIPLRHDKWDPAFLEYVTRLNKEKPVIFTGDLNVAHKPIDLARPTQNEGKKGYTKEERDGFQNYIDAGFVDTFRLFNKEGDNYTWWTHWANARARNVGWRIDYILASKELKKHIKDARIHPKQMGSDHCPTSITLEI